MASPKLDPVPIMIVGIKVKKNLNIETFSSLSDIVFNIINNDIYPIKKYKESPNKRAVYEILIQNFEFMNLDNELKPINARGYNAIMFLLSKLSVNC